MYLVKINCLAKMAHTYIAYGKYSVLKENISSVTYLQKFEDLKFSNNTFEKYLTSTRTSDYRNSSNSAIFRD